MNADASSSQSDASSSRPSRGKSVLFCAECSFENPVSEGWLVVSDGDERTIVCPECGHVADHRTARSAPAPRAD
jgi:DNA-directed RNA polymerase subunit RPC12/RpoP